MSSTTAPDLGFAELNLPAFLLKTLERVGYEKPSPIQQATIPALLEGKDIVGMAQTGTGKTAAFALPILAKIDVTNPSTQALVLCPTRELAIQVAEAFQTYAEGLKGFHVLPVYGGQDMSRQLQALRRGVHVVVATPGRLLDHLNRRSLDLKKINTLVLDEADEMLRMGFIDDVETILQQTPSTRQVALFSATMPPPIRNVAEKYLHDPQEVRIKSATSTNSDIDQYYWLVQGTNKLDALTRMLEVEDFDGMIVFVRTKNSTVELAEKLNARGFSAAALNGDMNQQLRTRTVEQLKNGQLDIVVATDVAARGLDVERISHVMNYDIPYDNEAYVHRIGRTGRAGRSGKAVLFVAPREQRMLQSIERTTRKKITRMELPTRGDLILKRSQQFKQTIADALAQDNLDFFRSLIADLCQEHECSLEDAAAAMAFLLQKDRPLEPSFKEVKETGYGTSKGFKEKASRSTQSAGDDFAGERPARKPRSKVPTGDEYIGSLLEGDDAGERAPRKRREQRDFSDGDDVPMEHFRLAVGHDHGVTPREIVGAIANEGGIEGRYIGRIQIFDDHTTIDLPTGMPDEVFQTLQRTRVCNQALNLERVASGPAPDRGRRSRPEGARKPRSAGPRREAFTEPTRPPRAARQDRFADSKPGGDRPRFDRSADKPESDKPRGDRFKTGGFKGDKFKSESRGSKFGGDKFNADKPKEKKRGAPKKRVDKDKGKRRSPVRGSK
ncbi:MAG: DEAD/DEAH box helicase [Pseudomonadota bacterium]|nr:DEAD/DEAH box helicase [Pseudomonadota bacterium]